MEELNGRYARHYSLKGFGAAGQQKLAAAAVLVIGAGGLGCPALQYLAAAGVGNIAIADHDTVMLSNLQRQVLFTTEDIGKPKAEVAATRLKALNPEINITAINQAITTANALEIISKYDVVADCTDNFATRYLVNDACVMLDKPLVFGAISQYEGQVGVFAIANIKGDKINYRHLFATPPNPLEIQDCNEAGVLGVLPGTIGILQATEVIKIITGIGQVLAGRLLVFNLLNYQTHVFEIAAHDLDTGLLPADEAAFKATDYEWVCGTKAAGVNELDAETFLNALQNPDTVVVDVRENHELPKPGFDCVAIPLSGISQHVPDVKQQNIILFCQSGKRSLKAGQLFLEHYKGQKTISHLAGGILALHEYGQKH
jgi:sulfur-carrier protein adenylyltransferase/sulfurtransferase